MENRRESRYLSTKLQFFTQAKKLFSLNQPVLVQGLLQHPQDHHHHHDQADNPADPDAAPGLCEGWVPLLPG